MLVLTIGVEPQAHFIADNTLAIDPVHLIKFGNVVIPIVCQTESNCLKLQTADLQTIFKEKFACQVSQTHLLALQANSN